MSKHYSVAEHFLMPVVILLMLMTLASIPLHADTYSFFLGPQPSPIPTVNGEAVGPYPGTLTDTTDNTVLPFGQFMCLDGNISTQWGSTLTGTVSHPDDQEDDEAAFLASLLLYDATQMGVTLPSSSAPNPSPTYTQAFMNAYSGPITFAIWQIMGTLPPSVAEPAGTQAFVNQAVNVYNTIFNNPSSPEYAAGQAFLSSVDIFTPTPPGSNQRFISVVPDTLTTTPEPGTWGLLAAGLLLAGLNRKRLARR
jgi:hypothetical protein